MFGFLNNYKYKIGFVIDNQNSYWEAMASTRLRCYDIIKLINNNYFHAELYREESNYDLVIFQKCFKEEYLKLAKKLKAKDTTIILDINVNYIDINDNSELVTKEQNESIRKMLEVTDHLLVSSQMLFQVYSTFHPSVFLIEEGVSPDFFKINKQHISSNIIYLVYCGYSIKARETLLIKDVLVQLHNDYKIKMLYITEKDPGLHFIPYQFIKYDQRNLPNQLVKGDIKIAPRDLTHPYNLGHTFTKVAYPMAVGLPAVASSLPSYMNREVLICYNDRDWYETLSLLIKSVPHRNFFGKRGKKFVERNFTQKIIKQQYLDFLDLIRR